MFFSFHKKNLPASGDLRKIPAYMVLAWGNEQNFTGLITFEREHRAKQLRLSKGNIMDLTSNLVAENLEAVLPKRSLENQEIEEIHRFLRQDRLLNLLGWFEGTYRVEEGADDSSSSSGIRLSNFLSIVEDLLLCQKDNLPAFERSSSFKTEGALKVTSGAWVIIELIRSKAKGTLLFERGERRKKLEFDLGRIASVASSDPAETLATTLTRRGHVTEEMSERLESVARSQQKRFRDLLLQEKIVSEQILNEALQFLHLERVLEAFAWRSGRYEFRGKRESEVTAPKTPGKSDWEVLISKARENSLPWIEFLSNRPKMAKRLAGFFAEYATKQGHKVWLVPHNREIRPSDLKQWKTHGDIVVQVVSSMKSEISLEGNQPVRVAVIERAETSKTFVKILQAKTGDENPLSFLFVESTPRWQFVNQLISRWHRRA